LVRLGLMAGRSCCVSWYHYWDLKKTFPDVTPVADRLFVVDGPRITCAGGTGAIDLAAWIVTRHLGRSVADKALHILIADGARPADAPQPHVIVERPSRDPRLTDAVNIMEQNLAQPLTVEDVAARAGLSRRQLERIFRDEFGVSPWKYALGRRLRHAHLLLTSTERSVTDIAHECGFADASHFSRHIRAAFGATPGTVRDTAIAAGAAQPPPATTAAPAASVFEPRPAALPQKVGFLLLPLFSMMAFTPAVEPLRAANRLSGRTLYSWHTASIDGKPV